MLVLITAVAAVIIWSVFSKKQRDEESKRRSMSFSSQIMAQGSFPESATVAAPIINTILKFKTLPSEENTKKALQRLLDVNRFRSVPDYSLASKQWEFREVNAKIEDHVVSHKVNSEEEMLKLVEVIQKKKTHDHENKPEWIFHRIENTGAGVSMILGRFHHAIGDGISLVKVMNKILTDKSGKPVEVALPGGKYDGSKKKAAPSFFSQVGKLVQAVLKSAAMGVSQYDSDIIFSKPNRPKAKMSSATMYNVYFPSLRLDFVKDIKNKAGCSLNDVMLAATTGAIRRYCEALGDPAMKAGQPPLRYRALLPYAFPRPLAESSDPFRCMRNKWAFLSVPMPINATTAKARLEAASATMNELKSSPEAFVQLWLQDTLMSRLPTFLVRQIAFDIFSRQSMVFSNVPGPQELTLFGGEPVLGFQATFPNILDQVLILSYCGSIFMNMVVDTEVVKDTELLKKSFLAEIIDMAKAYGIDTSDESKVLSPLSEGGKVAIACNV